MIIGKNLSDEAAAEKIMRQRARVMPAMIAMFAAIHFVAAKDIIKNDSVLDVSMFSWTVLVLVFLSVIATGGSYVMRKPGIRAFFNDELTINHRLKSFATGFWALTLGGLCLLFASIWMTIPNLLAIHSLIGLGITAAITRYTLLERRAFKS